MRITLDTEQKKISYDKDIVNPYELLKYIDYLETNSIIQDASEWKLNAKVTVEDFKISHNHSNSERNFSFCYIQNGCQDSCGVNDNIRCIHIDKPQGINYEKI